MRVSFSSLFGELFEDSTLAAVFAGCEVENIRIFKEKRLMELDLVFGRLVTDGTLEKAQKTICEKLMLDAAVIYPKMPPESFSPEFYASLVARTNKAVAASNGFFKGSTCDFDSKTLKISLTHGGADILRSCGCDTFMANEIRKLFSREISVVFDGADVSVEDEQVQQMMKKAEENTPAPVFYREQAQSSKPKEHKTVEGVPLYLETAKPIYGSKITKPPVTIKSVSPEDGSCVIWGDIFSFESRETRDGRSCIITFNVSDGTYAYGCKVFERKEHCEKLLEKLKDGVTVLLRGDITYDKYSGENVISPRAISLVDKIPPTDSAEEKRVELHLHTKMSMMDGMTDAADLVKRAIAW